MSSPMDNRGGWTGCLENSNPKINPYQTCDEKCNLIFALDLNEPGIRGTAEWTGSANRVHMDLEDTCHITN